MICFVRLFHSPAMRGLVFIVCASLVAYGIFRASPPPTLFDNSDKVGHLVAFFGLAVSARLAMFRLSGWIFWPVLFGLAPLLEYLQGEWLPLREYSLEDSYANGAGVALALLLFWVFSVLRRNK